MQFGHTNILRISITLETLRILRYPQTSKLHIEKLLLFLLQFSCTNETQSSQDKRNGRRNQSYPNINLMRKKRSPQSTG